MKNKLKATVAATLCLILCVCMTGCGKNKSNNPDDITDKEAEQALGELEKEYGDDTADDSSSKTEDEKIEYAPTQEIMDADLNSGLIQIGNNVFQQGGYITVAELVEQYSDQYDILYNGTPYEKSKNELIEFKENPFYIKSGFSSSFNGYSLEFKPKTGNPDNYFCAQVGNITSPDEKITLDKAVVYSYSLFSGGFLPVDISNRYETLPIWLPGGIGLVNTNDLKQTNDKYIFSNMEKDMKDKGLTPADTNAEFKTDLYKAAANGSGIYTIFEDHKQINIKIAGKENLGGYKPIYSYSLGFSKDTLTIDSNATNVFIESFYKEES